MAEIYTSKGMIEESELRRETTKIDNDNESTMVVEWFDKSGECVKRQPTVNLK